MIVRIHPDGRVERLPTALEARLAQTAGVPDPALTAALRAGALSALLEGTHAPSTTTAATAGVGASAAPRRGAPPLLPSPRVAHPGEVEPDTDVEAGERIDDEDPELDEDERGEIGPLEIADPVPRAPQETRGARVPQAPRRTGGTPMQAPARPQGGAPPRIPHRAVPGGIEIGG